ncbi:Hypothetical protein CINCED_3A023778, partial [Cinara cedri]
TGPSSLLWTPAATHDDWPGATPVCFVDVPGNVATSDKKKKKRNFFTGRPFAEQMYWSCRPPSPPPRGGPEDPGRDSCGPSVPCEAYGGGDEAVLLLLITKSKTVETSDVRILFFIVKSRSHCAVKKFCFARIKFKEENCPRNIL